MNKTKNKKFYYRRAIWDDAGKVTFETLIAEAHKKLPTLESRSFLLAGGNEIQGAVFDSRPEGFLIQIAYYSPGQATSTIGTDKTTHSATIDAEAAPPGKDYLHGDMFVLIKGNHVFLCPSSVRESVAEQYFYIVLNKLEMFPVGLRLSKVAKSSKVKMIKTEGVKEIQLGASLYEASLIEIDERQNKVSSLKARIAHQLQQIFADDKSLNTIKESENLSVNISIKFDGKEGRKIHKDPHFGEAGRERLLKASQKILNEVDEDGNEGFVIITNSGTKITPGEIREFESYKVEALGKSLSRTDAWTKLISFCELLKENGTLAK